MMAMSENEKECVAELVRRVKPIADAYWCSYSARQHVIEWSCYICIEPPEDEDGSYEVHVAGAQCDPEFMRFMFFFNFEETMAGYNLGYSAVKRQYYYTLENDLANFLNAFNQKDGDYDAD